jgi:hypothetical protein
LTGFLARGTSGLFDKYFNMITIRGALRRSRRGLPGFGPRLRPGFWTTPSHLALEPSASALECCRSPRELPALASSTISEHRCPRLQCHGHLSFGMVGDEREGERWGRERWSVHGYLLYLKRSLRSPSPARRASGGRRPGAARASGSLSRRSGVARRPARSAVPRLRRAAPSLSEETGARLRGRKNS